MEHELRFGLVVITEKIRFGPIMSNFKVVFSSFHGQKKKKKKNCSVRTKKLRKIKFKNIFLFVKKGKKHFQLWDFSLMTLLSLYLYGAVIF